MIQQISVTSQLIAALAEESILSERTPRFSGFRTAKKFLVSYERVRRVLNRATGRKSRAFLPNRATNPTRAPYSLIAMRENVKHILRYMKLVLGT
jgi:hypothetical protein